MTYTKIVDEDVNSIINFCDSELLSKKLKNKSILVTGASGMIGSYLIYTMIKLNEKYQTNIKINALVRNVNKLDIYIKNNSNVKIIIGDVTEPLNITDNIDYIIHAASPASPKIMSEHPVETNFANTIGTANTLKLAQEKKALGYLFISSREVYGEPLDGQEVFTEDGMLGQVNPLIPRNGYAEGKKAAENMCVSFKDEYNLNTKIVRLAHTYGPGMSIYDGRVQADFLNNIIHKENIVLKSDGSSVRTYTYIADAIKAIILVLLNSTDIVYNVSDDKKITIKELANILINLVPEKKLQLVFDIQQNNSKGTASFKNGILSNNKIKNELNWEPSYTIEEGFQRTIEHLKEEFNELNNETSSNNKEN